MTCISDNRFDRSSHGELLSAGYSRKSNLQGVFVSTESGDSQVYENANAVISRKMRITLDPTREAAKRVSLLGNRWHHTKHYARCLSQRV